MLKKRGRLQIQELNAVSKGAKAVIKAQKDEKSAN
jgi:hypothetical protein